MRALLFALVALTIVVGCSVGGDGPRLIASQRLPDDVQTLTDDTWEAFLASFPAQARCIGRPHLVLVDDIEAGAAEYLPLTRTIEIEIPTSPQRYSESLVHELGHHLERSCAVREEIGPAILDGQGFDPDTAWSTNPAWEDRPSEHFAEAVVERVLGERITHGDLIAVNSETLDTVSRWSTPWDG